MKMFGSYEVYNGGQFLYTVPEYEAYTELGVWLERGYNATINNNDRTINIGKKK